MRFFLIFSLLAMAACSSTPKNSNGTAAEPDVVLSRIDDLSSRPNWLKESEPFAIAGGDVVSLGQTQIPGDHRVEAAFRIAENNAKAQIAKAIEQRLDFVFQNAEEGTSMDATQARSIGAEAASLTSSTLRVEKRYWEKVMTTDDGGSKKTIYRVYTTVKMPESDFKRSIMDAIRKQQGKSGVSADFAQKVNQHWDKFVGASPAPVAESQ